jgi:hypothetical protein
VTQKNKGKGDKLSSFIAFVIAFLVIALILVFVVAFIHDLFTGQLPSGGGYDDGGDGGYDGFGRR